MLFLGQERVIKFSPYLIIGVMPLKSICASVRYMQTRFTQSDLKSIRRWVLFYMLCERSLLQHSSTVK